MKETPPECLPINWICKPVESARSGVDILPDGRVHCWVEHEVIRNVTPAMLVWWFTHIDGSGTINGITVDRYRLWHPCDHISHEYITRNANGSVGVGCTMHIVEMLGGRPEYLVDVESIITKLDETGFNHQPRVHGLPAIEANYEFERTSEGTLYRNSLTIGFQAALARSFNRLVRPLGFDEAYRRAWIKHNVEEVGNFESFLPALYASEGNKS